MMRWTFGALLFVTASAIAACAPRTASDAGGTASANLSWNALQDSTHRAVAVGGFSGPEAVRYDPDQDVYFVSNFNGAVAGDANGFISRVGPTGSVEALEFMRGTQQFPLHAPRGMFIVGDTLWAADAEGLHGFHRRTGQQLAFVDFRRFEPGFLNDVAPGPDGALYVTDTGKSRLYRMRGGNVAVVIDDTQRPPNGVTWDPQGRRLVLAPWGGDQTFRAWRGGGNGLEDAATSLGGNFDGIEFVGSRMLAASQADSTIYVIESETGRPLIKLPGRPADIGIDTRRSRVAVPYVALNRVDIWALPRR